MKLTNPFKKEVYGLWIDYAYTREFKIKGVKDFEGAKDKLLERIKKYEFDFDYDTSTLRIAYSYELKKGVYCLGLTICETVMEKVKLRSQKSIPLYMEKLKKKNMKGNLKEFYTTLELFESEKI